MRRHGFEQKVDPDLIVPNPDQTLKKGAVAPWAKSPSPYYAQTLAALGAAYKFRMDDRWSDLSQEARDAILYGSGDRGDPLRLCRRDARL